MIFKSIKKKHGHQKLTEEDAEDKYSGENFFRLNDTYCIVGKFSIIIPEINRCTVFKELCAYRTYKCIYNREKEIKKEKLSGRLNTCGV